jgi:ribulose-5-phosphate 4-epimerase/fuculose-1-phosphate aldolase
MKCGLLPLTQQAMFLHGSVSYHTWDLQQAEGECDRLSADLGPDSTAMILNNHGLLSCGPTVASAFITLYNLEIACKVQADVVASGGEWIVPDADAIERTAAVGRTEALTGETEWAAVLRRLDKVDVSYKT